MPSFVQENGFHQHDYVAAGGTAVHRIIYCALPVLVLSNKPVEGSDRLVLVDGNRDLTVYADFVIVLGQIVAASRTIRIFARKIRWAKDPSSANAPGIVTSGIRGTKPEVLRSAPDPSPLTPPKSPNGSVTVHTFAPTDLVHGQPGKAGDQHAQIGADGEDGASAGDIEITAFESVGDFQLIADGGNGNGGQDGQNGQNGGDGGDGAKGEYWVKKGRYTGHYKYIYADPGPGGAGGSAGAGGAGGAGGDAGKITVRLGPNQQGAPTYHAVPGTRGADGRDGKPGIGGMGGKPANPKSPPAARAPDGRLARPAKDRRAINKAGKLTETSIQPLKSLADLAQFWHPAVARLQLRRMKSRYLSAEIGDKDAGPLGEDLLSLQTLLTPLFLDNGPGSVHGEIAQQELVGILGEVNRMIGNLGLGRDYFGHSPDYAPNPSYAYYAEALQKALDDFKKFEERYRSLETQAKSGALAKNEAEAAFNDAVATAEAAAEELPDARKAVVAAQKRVDEVSGRVDELKKALDPSAPKVQSFAAAIRNDFHCDLAQLLEGLGMMAFAPPYETPEKRGGKSAPSVLSGLKGAGAVMAGVQLAQFISHGLQTIKTIDGETLDTSYVLNATHRLGQDLFKSAQQIIFDRVGHKYDVGGEAILATLDEWDELVCKFINLPSAVQLRQDIRSLADAVRERGEAVMGFNKCLSDLLFLLELSSDAEKQRIEQLQKLADLSNPGFGDVVRFVTRHYEARKEACIELLYLANRAYAYWTLVQPGGRIGVGDKAHGDNVFRETLIAQRRWDQSDIFSAMDWQILDACRAHLHRWFGQDIASYSDYPTPFPDEKGADGLQIFIANPADLGKFKELRKYKGRSVHYLKFAITPDGAGGTYTQEKLRGYADVRLTAFRVFLQGAQCNGPDKRIQLQFIHDSRDTNYTVTGAMRTFSRPELEPKTFTYRTDLPRYLEGDPGKFSSGFIFMDGRIGDGHPTTQSIDARESLYAGVGPYTDWTIILDPGQNSGVSIDNLSAIEIQLCGVARTRT